MGSSQLEAPPPLPKVSRSAARRREWTLWIGRSSDGALLPLVSSGMYSSVTAWRTSLGASAACVPWGAGAATTAPESPASLLLEVKPATSRLLRTAGLGGEEGWPLASAGSSAGTPPQASLPRQQEQDLALATHTASGPRCFRSHPLPGGNFQALVESPGKPHCE
eukprot:CAMPEP_0115696380 /NCGR_PEP_ID=MMETSP0272-20121206/65249_1 /TAXON_ID=71861 /ORGANISM="Scrippsiella trochoidea, Strain CCMP3099" /LENGTH=164 /DNA_ID=CAMNT_0003136603 /DNA_START=269 /DNA_END=761 /DNA_ORIENTATION=-